MLCCPKDTLEGDAAVLCLGPSLLFLPRHLAHEVLRLRKRVISFTDSFGLGQVSMVTVRGGERACPHFPNSWNRQGGTAIQQWWSLAFRLEPVVELGLQTGTCWLYRQGGLGLSLCFSGLDALNCKTEVTVDNHFPEAWGWTYV